MSKILDNAQCHHTGMQTHDWFGPIRTRMPKYVSLDVDHHAVKLDCDPFLHQHTVHVKLAANFSCPSDQFLHAKRNAEKQIISALYSDILPHLTGLRSAIYAGDRQQCLEILDNINKDIGL
jgi:hypothetical protein